MSTEREVGRRGAVSHGTVNQSRLGTVSGAGRRSVMTEPSQFKWCKTTPEVVRLAVMIDDRLPLSLRHVENLLHERSGEVSGMEAEAPLLVAPVERQPGPEEGLQRELCRQGPCDWTNSGQSLQSIVLQILFATAMTLRTEASLREGVHFPATPKSAPSPCGRLHGERERPALTRRSGIELSIEATPGILVKVPTRKRSNSASPWVAILRR